MKYLKISNNGVLDIRIIALMGGTTKSSNQYKIGQFGSGLKYSMAYLFRNKIDFKIFVEEKEVEIKTRKENICDTDFEIIHVAGEKTSITTQMGNDWKPWMIVREIYSNALDEGDSKFELVETPKGEDGRTSFFIELTPEFLEVYNNWNKYFINNQEAFYEDENVKIYPQSGELRIYKQGILIDTQKKNSLFNYDFKNARLNELREYKGFLESDVAKSIMRVTNKKVIQFIIEHIDTDHYESTVDFDYNWGYTFSKEWGEKLEGCKIIHEEALKKLKARGVEVDLTSTIIVPESLYKGLSKKFEAIGALRASKAVNDFYEIYNETLQDKIHKAKNILEKAGYYIEPELSFIYGVFGDKNVMAKVDLDSKKIYVSEKHLDTDYFSICTMLIEENEHYKTGLQDHTRGFQQHFIDLYANQLIGETISAI